ncbi:MAG: hypothetical protein AAB656_00580 [Patescibacteria group bacterium]
MENQSRQFQLSDEVEKEILSMNLQELRRLFGSIERARIGNQEFHKARKRTPDEQFIVNVWFDREREQIAEENLAEHHKMLRGEPNDFDEYAPY